MESSGRQKEPSKNRVNGIDVVVVMHVHRTNPACHLDPIISRSPRHMDIPPARVVLYVDCHPNKPLTCQVRDERVPPGVVRIWPINSVGF